MKVFFTPSVSDIENKITTRINRNCDTPRTFRLPKECQRCKFTLHNVTHAQNIKEHLILQ